MPTSSRCDPSQVRVFYHDQNSSWEQPATVVPRAIAREMKADGFGKFIDNGMGFRLYENRPHRTTDHLIGSDSPCSCSAISVVDMLSNVGITPNADGDPPLRWMVERAQLKISSFETENDERSPLARGRHSECNLTEPCAS